MFVTQRQLKNLKEDIEFKHDIDGRYNEGAHKANKLCISKLESKITALESQLRALTTHLGGYITIVEEHSEFRKQPKRS